jgi:hypothetical protein
MDEVRHLDLTGAGLDFLRTEIDTGLTLSNIAPYRLAGMTMNTNSPDSFSIAKFVVEGVVKDDQGNPVEGAALHICKEVVYSNSSGHFQVRFPRHGPYPPSVAPEEFITSGVFETVSAPHEVRAESEDSATDIVITLRHALRPPAQLNHP